MNATTVVPLADTIETNSSHRTTTSVFITSDYAKTEDVEKKVKELKSDFHSSISELMPGIIDGVLEKRISEIDVLKNEIFKQKEEISFLTADRDGYKKLHEICADELDDISDLQQQLNTEHTFVVDQLEATKNKLRRSNIRAGLFLVIIIAQALIILCK